MRLVAARDHVAAGVGGRFAGFDGAARATGQRAGVTFFISEARERQRHVAGVLDQDLVFDRLSDRHRAGFVAVAFGADALELFDRVVRFGFDRHRDFVGGFVAGAFAVFDRGFVGVTAGARERVFARERLFFAVGQFGGAGGRDVFAGGVFEGGEFERHVAGVLDDHLVFDLLAVFAAEFVFGVGAFAAQPLELFDRVGRFRGDFDRDFVGRLGAGAFAAFDRGFVGVGAGGRQRVAAGKGSLLCRPPVRWCCSAGCQYSRCLSGR